MGTYDGIATEVIVSWRDGAWYANDIRTLEACTRELHRRGADPTCACPDTEGHVR